RWHHGRPLVLQTDEGPFFLNRRTQRAHRMESLGYLVLFAVIAPFLTFACCGVLAAVVAVAFFAYREQDLPKLRKRE
ncbi:MAG: hypothetical protein AAB427_04750, partial [Chloroflexota bacterium]